LHRNIKIKTPDHFLEDTPTAVLIRQVLGVVAQFEKASLVAKLKGARDRLELGRNLPQAAVLLLREPLGNLNNERIALEHGLAAAALAGLSLLAQGFVTKSGKPF
jgi:hypothetical protein